MSDVFKVQPLARLKLTKNTLDVLFDQPFRPADAVFAHFAAQAVQVAASTSLTLSFGSVTAARHVILQVDNPANLKLNASATVLPLLASGVYFAANSSVTSIKVINPSSTLAVTVNYGVTD